MNVLVPAQAGAQLLSLFVYGAIARWYVAPWLKTRGRAEALTALLWVQVFRYVALQVFASQASGELPISDGGAIEIVLGDLGGAVLAFVTIALLRARVSLAIPLAWLLVAETIFDTVSNIRGGVHEHLMGAARGTTWMVLVFFVPLVIVSLALLAWQLAARRHESLGSATRAELRRGEAPLLRAS